MTLPRSRLTAAVLVLGAVAAAQQEAPPREPPPQPPVQEPAEPPPEERARAAEAEGDLARAAELWARAARARPEQSAWWLAAARDFVAVGRHLDALDVLDAARAYHPDDPEVATATAKTYNLEAERLLSQGIRDAQVLWQFEEAARVAEAVLRTHPEARDLRLILAQSLYQLGDLEGALAAAEEAARRFPSHPGGHVLVGKIALQDFVALRRRIREEQPQGKAQEELLELARDARERAVTAFERAITADPDRAIAHALLGDVFAWQGNVEQALESYVEALVLDPHTKVDHRWIAANASPERRIELYSEAAARYRETAVADARAAALLDWWLAYAHFEAGDLRDAYVLFERSVDANPDYLNSRGYAMLAAYRNQAHDNAEKQAALFGEAAPRRFADFVRSHTDVADVTAILEYLARRSFEAGRIARSRAINHVLAMVRDTDEHWNNYAFLCRETGRYQDSLEAYMNALSIAPDSPQLLNDAAVVLHYHLPSDENLQRAETLYRRAIEEADRILDDPGADPEARSAARRARADARNNLRALGR